MILDALSKGLITSFIDQSSYSEDIYQTKLVQNNYPLEKVINTFEGELEHCTRFWFTTAFLSMSGFNTLYSLLENLQRRNVPGRILVSQYLNFTQPDALKRLKKFKNIEVRIDTKSDLHAKTYVFQREDHISVLLGSSNLTANALSKNEELNIFIRALPQSKIMRDMLLKKKILFISGFLQNFILTILPLSNKIFSNSDLLAFIKLLYSIFGSYLLYQDGAFCFK